MLLNLNTQSYPPSAAYMCQWIGSSLVQVMACRLLGAKPLPEPMLPYCQLNSWEQISVKFEPEFYHFQKMHLKMWSPKIAAILSRGNELILCGLVSKVKHEWKPTSVKLYSKSQITKRLLQNFGHFFRRQCVNKKTTGANIHIVPCS